jgi:hypothetical protein
VPDYQERGEWLEENGHRLIFSGRSGTH